MCSMQTDFSDGLPRLIADIGGTNARFALETAPQRFGKIAVLPTKDYADLAEAVRAYLNSAGNPEISRAAFAIANPITGDRVKMTNCHWAFSIEETRCALGLDTLLMLNDFTAQALAMPHIPADKLRQIGGGAAADGSPKAVIGPGTGLGVSGLIADGRGGWTALAGEGGHQSFAPFDDLEAQIWMFARQKFGHVSFERFLCGAGLSLIHEALLSVEGRSGTPAAPAEITAAAFSGGGETAELRRVLDIFCAMLGTAAADLVLTLGARGGVYLVGGILPRFADYFAASPFRSRFENKGRFGAYLRDVPAYLVLADYPGLSGAAAALQRHPVAKT